MGRHAEHEQDRLLPLHAGDPDAARPRGGDRHAARGGARERVRRHARFAEATRRACAAWGLEILCRDPKYYSPTVTAVLLPEGHDADALRRLALDHFDISYGMSFGKLAGRYFRIGHLGDTNDLTILGALAGTEMALTLAGVPIKKGGVQAAMDYIVVGARHARSAPRRSSRLAPNTGGIMVAVGGDAQVFFRGLIMTITRTCCTSHWVIPFPMKARIIQKNVLRFDVKDNHPSGVTVIGFRRKSLD